MTIESSVSPREFGQLEMKVEFLQKQMAELTATVGVMAGQVREINDTMQQARGGWRTILALITVGASLGGLLVRFFPNLSSQ